MISPAACSHECPVCDAVRSHEPTAARPCVFTQYRICDECIALLARSAERELFEFFSTMEKGAAA